MESSLALRGRIQVPSSAQISCISNVLNTQNDLFDEVAARRDDWPELFSTEDAALIAAHWSKIMDVRVELEASREHVLDAPTQLVHTDLHPHNVLMNHSQLVAFLDFDSYKQAPLGAALGFAAYKLIRQVGAHRGRDSSSDGISASAHRFVDGVRLALSLTSEDYCRLALFAKTEVFRRLMVIFRLTLRARDLSWNHVLPMHLAGFEEIDVIFRELD